MRAERTITSSFRKAVLLGLVSLCSTFFPVSDSLLLAEEPLFHIIAANRSTKLPTAPRRGIKSSHRAKLSSSASLKNFSVEINGQKIFGKLEDETIRTLDTSSKHGKLFSSERKEIGHFIHSVEGSSSHTFFLSEVGHAALTVNANEATWEEYDSSSMPGCGHDEHDFSEDVDHSVKSFKSYDDVSITSSVTIDIMLLYTETAASKNGVDALLAELKTAVAGANLAFSNSQVPAQYRLVHTAQVPDTYEKDMALALGELRADPEVAALREKFGADLVSLIVGGDNHKYCGLGYVPYTPEAVFKADNGFSVVSKNCLNNLSLPHELGHNLGLHHDKDNAPKTTAYAFSYGHRFGHDASEYRTTMAYQPGVRLAYFSNPEVTYNGFPTGDDGANNAQVLKLTTPIIANYFQGNEEEDSNEDENSNPGNEEESPEEGSEKALTPATMDVEKEETKNRTTFTLSLRTENGDPVADRNIDIYQYKKGERTKLLATVVTGADGSATYAVKRSRKARTLSFLTEPLPEVVVKIAKSRSASRKKRN